MPIFLPRRAKLISEGVFQNVSVYVRLAMAYSREAKKADKDIGTVLGGKEIKELDLYYNVYASWQIQLLQLVDGLNVWLDYVD